MRQSFSPSQSISYSLTEDYESNSTPVTKLSRKSTRMRRFQIILQILTATMIDPMCQRPHIHPHDVVLGGALANQLHPQSRKLIHSPSSYHFSWACSAILYRL